MKSRLGRSATGKLYTGINCLNDPSVLGIMSQSSTHSYHRSFPSSSLKMMLFITLFIASFLTGMTNGLKINSNGGYEDVTISIGHDVPPITCQQLIQNLQVCFDLISPL